MGRARVAIAWIAVAAAASASGWWAGRATFNPPTPPAAVAPLQTYEVAQGTIGNTTTLSAAVRWPKGTKIAGAIQGTVTSLPVDPGAVVNPGDTLLTVDLKPVIAAKGSVPAFRDLVEGDVGEDVSQLQHLLSVGGHFKGKVDGRFRASTTTAVKLWQKVNGLDVTGRIPKGQILFFAEMPARVAFDEAIQVGAVISPGDPLLYPVSPFPSFEVAVNPESRTDVPASQTPVRVWGPEGQWEGIVGAAHRDDEDNLVIALVAADGSPICGNTCKSVPFTEEELRYDAVAILSPEVTGPIVPLSAIAAAPDGKNHVCSAQGEKVPVDVLATDGSRSVISGVAVGDELRLFGCGSSPAQSIATPSATSSAQG